MPQKIIIDTDPGIDDTMAITFALRSPELEVIGLTSVFGNSNIENTSLNALRLVELEGHDHIPVARGCEVALFSGYPHHASAVHGEDGFGNTNPGLPKGKLHPLPAASFIVEQVLAHPGEVTLVPVGPLTNIALALRLEPKIAGLVKEVVLMGGAATVPGNVNPVAEANIIHDPLAAAIVFGADWKVTMVGLDVTTRTIMTRNYLKTICSFKNPAAELIGKILPCYQNYFDRLYGMDGSICTHDPSAIAYLIKPDLYRCEMVPTFVETEGRCAGQTIPDFGNKWGDARAVNICLEVNANSVLDLFMDRLKKEG